MWCYWNAQCHSVNPYAVSFPQFYLRHIFRAFWGLWEDRGWLFHHFFLMKCKLLVAERDFKHKDFRRIPCIQCSLRISNSISLPSVAPTPIFWFFRPRRLYFYQKPVLPLSEVQLPHWNDCGLPSTLKAKQVDKWKTEAEAPSHVPASFSPEPACFSHSPKIPGSHFKNLVLSIGCYLMEYYSVRHLHVRRKLPFTPSSNSYSFLLWAYSLHCLSYTFSFFFFSLFAFF